MPSNPDLEQALLGPLVAGRECGDCVMCCDVLKIDTPTFRKPAETLCRHSSGHGCGIHATRPEVCRAWFCGWRRIAAMPQDARPDLSGLLVSLDFNRQPRNCLEGVSIVVRSVRDDAELDAPTARRLVDLLSSQLVPVWTSDGAAKTLVHPRGEIATAVISGEPPAERLRAEVGAWRARYDVFR
jgi:hypothetical protein